MSKEMEERCADMRSDPLSCWGYSWQMTNLPRQRLGPTKSGAILRLDFRNGVRMNTAVISKGIISWRSETFIMAERTIVRVNFPSRCWPELRDGLNGITRLPFLI